MVVMGIIGILTAIALPSYRTYIQKANRAAAESFMLNVANKQEQFLLDKRKYFCTTGSCTNLIALPVTVPTEVARNYTISATAVDTTSGPPTFSISAAPLSTGGNATDTKCATLTYTSAQVKSQSGTGSVSDCW